MNAAFNYSFMHTNASFVYPVQPASISFLCKPEGTKQQFVIFFLLHHPLIIYTLAVTHSVLSSHMNTKTHAKLLKHLVSAFQ